MAPHFAHSERKKRLSAFAMGVFSVLPLFIAANFALAEQSDDRPRRDLSLVQRVRLPEPQDASSGRFELIESDRSGIDFVHRWAPPSDQAYLLNSGAAGGGVAIGDVDGDDRADVYLSRPFGGGRLYRNRGGFRFEDVTDRSGLAGDMAWGGGTSFVDIENDGDLDLFVTGYDCPNRLFINNGQGVFVERGQENGLDFAGASVMMSFADYDRDGDVDGFLVTSRNISPDEAQRLKAKSPSIRHYLVLRDGRPEIVPEMREVIDLMLLPNGEIKLFKAGQFARLYRNDGRGRFAEVAKQAGIVDTGQSLSATWWDYNHDGWPDLYLANDFHAPDRLFHNNGDGTFTDVVEAALPHVPWYSMGSDAGDLNNDGLLDFIATDMAGTTHYKSKIGMGDMSDSAWFLDYARPRQTMRNAVYLNGGTGRFFEAAHMLGLAYSDWTWAVKIADLDNDGWQDVFITNGMTRDWMNTDAQQRARREGRNDLDPDDVEIKRDSNLAFRNRGNLAFEDMSHTWHLAHESVSFGAAFGDLDGDGDLDLVVNNFEESASVYRNDIADGHRVKLRLVGTRSNRCGIDALVRIETAAGEQVRYLTLARGFASSDEPFVYFGLGEVTSIDRLTIRWPSGAAQAFENLPADHFYTITEPTAAAPVIPPSATKSTPEAQTIFARSDRLPAIRHRERSYDDFAREPLLPNKLSQLGPGMALGDADGDGQDDLYVGGAAGQGGRLYLRRDGRFEQQIEPIELILFETTEPFASDLDAEDMGAVFFDVEGDGDLDLYVVSGGVECEPEAAVLRDRLYLNDGHGSFSKAADHQLPDLRDAGSCVVAADFDRDGDLDLFVGGRSVPGRYPMTPRSRLLRNDSADGQPRLTDVTDLLAPSLQTSGLVTGAIWSDGDGDGWLDLFVTHEWGPVKFFRNDQGRLVDQTTESGLSERLGWYNGIVAGDVDRDGDIDYVVTNFGHNTKYHPTPEKPVAVYYGEFEGGGSPQIVESMKYDEGYFPVRGKSSSENAMPFLLEKFPTHHEFAMATLEEIYTPQCLQRALKVEVNSLSSGMLLNDGQGRFTFEPLPNLAQIAPTFGAALVDVDGDGWLDLVLAQNFFGPERETGRMDGGLSLLLLGDGRGRFKPVWPNASGLVVPEDAKSLVVTDLDDDNRPDLLLGINDGELLAYENRLTTKGKHLVVRLVGLAANRQAIGSRVILDCANGTRQTAEVYAGGGYLSQSTAAIPFGLGPYSRAKSISVRWPDGTTTTTLVGPEQYQLTIRQPDQAP